MVQKTRNLKDIEVKADNQSESKKKGSHNSYPFFIQKLNLAVKNLNNTNIGINFYISK